jgi:hypothetical protein
MTEWLHAEWRRVSRPLWLLAGVHALALLVLARFTNPLLWPAPLLLGLGGLYLVAGMALAAWQWHYWVPPARWITLLHQPLSPWRCARPLVAAAALLLVLALALPIAAALPVLAAFGHTVSPFHLGYAALALLFGLSGYFSGMAALLGRGWGRWLALPLGPLLWLALGAQPLPQLLSLGLLGNLLLAAWALGRVRPDLTRPPALGLELPLLLIPASWLTGAALQLLGQGALLLADRHPALHPGGPAHFEHWRSAESVELLAALWPAGGVAGWAEAPTESPLLRQLYPGQRLPERLSPGSEGLAQFTLPDTLLRAHYAADRQLYRLSDARRQAQGWLGLGCPTAQADAARPLGPEVPLPIQGGLLSGGALWVWRGNCLHPLLHGTEGGRLFAAQADADGWMALSTDGLLHTSQLHWSWPRPLDTVQTLLVWRQPDHARWLLLLLEGSFQQPAHHRLSLWILEPHKAADLLAERLLKPDFPQALTWSDTWPTPLRGLLAGWFDSRRPAPGAAVWGLLLFSSLVACLGSALLSRRRACTSGTWPWMLAALAAGPPLLTVQHALQR